MLAGDADHRQVDLVGDLGDVRVGAHACHGIASEVDRVRDPVEAGLEDVSIELAADRATPRRRAHDRHRARREERLQRRGDRDVVSLVHALPVAPGRLDRHPHLDGALLDGARDGEACVLEDAEHRPVRAHHVGDERLDAGGRSGFGQLLEQTGAGAVPLELVGDGERDLRRRGIAEPNVVREGHDALVGSLAERADERPALEPVRIEHRCDELVGE